MRFDLGTVPAVASAVVALTALVLSGLALAASRQSAAASEISAKTAQQALALATEARWTLTKTERGHALLLTNAGREPAYAVKVTADFISPPLSRDVIAGGEAVTFVDTRAINDDNMVTVTWHVSPDLSDPERRWRHPVVG
jgi:hypothetical protein